ncbi:MAG: GTP-binding protein [Candidatus Levybacteria bacterium]|nr:GTP-binding protein [Candidatus Levybacteria bacterium]
MAKKNLIATPSTSHNFPPVVTVLGHVDHGKTTLLDTIRKTSIASREHGGITQKIGASSVEIMHEERKRRITFIDTPGHEAFSLMRGRGVQAADIGLLIVSVVDGIMPQTKESIQLLKDTKTPFIVVLTKVDLPDRQVEKTKQQLLKEDVLLEGLGGDVPFIEVSAKTGKNVPELLDLIILVTDLHEILKGKSSDAIFNAIVIESKLDQKAGPKATIVVKNGTAVIRDELVTETTSARVRSFSDDKAAILKSVTVGDAAEVLGFADVPSVGSIVSKKGEHMSTSVVEMAEVEKEPQAVISDTSLPQDFFAPPGEKRDTVSLIIRADTLGSLEAIMYALPEKAIILSKKTGDISEADVLLAKSVGGLVIGFNVRIRPDVAHLASTEKVLMKNYTIIYELLQEISDVLEGKALAMEEKIYGSAQILASFPFEKTKVCGIKVLEGRIAKGDRARLLRGEDTIGECHVVSVRQGKDQTSKVEKGQEAGIIISPLLDFTIGDVIISHE